jgi:hypothetical protein
MTDAPPFEPLLRGAENGSELRQAGEAAAAPEILMGALFSRVQPGFIWNNDNLDDQ